MCNVPVIPKIISIKCPFCKIFSIFQYCIICCRRSFFLPSFRVSPVLSIVYPRMSICILNTNCSETYGFTTIQKRICWTWRNEKQRNDWFRIVSNFIILFYAWIRYRLHTYILYILYTISPFTQIALHLCNLWKQKFFPQSNPDYWSSRFMTSGLSTSIVFHLIRRDKDTKSSSIIFNNESLRLVCHMKISKINIQIQV